MGLTAHRLESPDGADCPVFAQIWNNRPSTEALRRNHEEDRFVRLDKWQRAEPPRDRAEPCSCGAPDRWKCWSRYSRRHVLGQARAVRPAQIFGASVGTTAPVYVCYPANAELDAAIQAAVARVLSNDITPAPAPGSDEPRKLPSKPFGARGPITRFYVANDMFRDLCASVAEEVTNRVARYRSERFTSKSLRMIALAELRRVRSPVETPLRDREVSDYRLSPTYRLGDFDEPGSGGSDEFWATVFQQGGIQDADD